MDAQQTGYGLCGIKGAPCPPPGTVSAMNVEGVVFTILALSMGTLIIAAPQETYKTAYDDVDIDALLQDDSRLQSMVQCFTSPKDDDCNDGDKHAKGLLPEVLATACAKCTEKQRHGLTKFLGATARKFPEQFKKLLAKYDPAGEYVGKISAGHLQAK